MKIGILTLFHGNDNWGGNLQGIALKSLIEKEYPGCIVDIVDYRSGCNVIYNNKIKQLEQYSITDISKKIVSIINNHIGKSMGNRLEMRKKLFIDFRESYHMNKHVYTDYTLKDMENDYDVLICGSDQIWNPNVARPGYFLQGLGNSCRKVSYAASIARDALSKHEKIIMGPLIEKFDYISVRENTAKKILEECITKPVKEVLDPALMLDSSEWTKLLNLSSSKEDSYALAFFFSDSLKYRKEIEKYCIHKNLQLIFIPFAAGYIKNDEVGECERIYDVGPKEFLNLFKNASCVFTDSFHGAVFSIIFQKQFWVFERDTNNKTSKNSRLHDLLAKFDLCDHLIVQLEDFDKIERTQINYEYINKMLNDYRKDSLDFLHQAIGKNSGSKKTHSRVDFLQKEECCGCSLCLEICPKHCIEMKSDREGFLYPQIKEENCIECGKCLKECRKRNNFEEKFLSTFIGYHKDDIIRKKSSSGGLFYELAMQILNDAGVVYGAAFDTDLSVKHIRVRDYKQLERVMTSKYVQSNMEGIYSQIIEDLKKERKVLFSGTPCQVASVKLLVQNFGLQNNLYLIDFVCHGVPSPGVWKSYLSDLTNGSVITKVNFREKTIKGWHDYHLTVSNKEHDYLRESHETNAFMRSFLSDKNVRLSCYNCSFKGKRDIADITLGDAWKIEREKPEWSDDKGTSMFIVRSEKGQMLINSLSEKFILEQSDYKKWTKYNPSIVSSTKFNCDRDKFFDDFYNMNQKTFWAKEKKISIKRKLRYRIKRLLTILKLGKLARKLYG